MATPDHKTADTDEKIFIGKGEETAWLTLALANRHGLVTGAKLCQRSAQADIVGLLLFQRLQRRADGLDEVAEGIFEIIERADPTVGIDQQVAQRLVLLADAGADIGQGRLAGLFGDG